MTVISDKIELEPGESGPTIYFYISEDEKQWKKKPISHQNTEKQEERTIRCGHCEHKITTPSHQIEIDGRFEHTFMNPDGHVFRIGCFDQAEGCVVHGESSSTWTWFQGFDWRVAFCGQCAIHLGWLYTSDHNDRFFGLNLDALI